MKLTFDLWERNTYDTKDIKVKTFDGIENYIFRPDQTEFTEILLGADNTSLYIRGNGEQYLLSFNADKNNFELQNDDIQPDHTEKIELKIKGELKTYSTRKVLTIEQALKSAQYFEFRDKGVPQKWKKTKNNS
ncbi:hypothetical protein [Elizabethkingia meningoseptica]|uniref:hypothetical protein n=1 Tax=Elizabethkingia meningoseptica TaxID=238 RepID=UPI003892C188